MNKVSILYTSFFFLGLPLGLGESVETSRTRALPLRFFSTSAGTASYALAETMPGADQYELMRFKPRGNKRLTLNIPHALVEDLLEHLGVVELLLDLADDALGQLALLSLLHLTLVADP